jgi:hypothetical protein
VAREADQNIVALLPHQNFHPSGAIVVLDSGIFSGFIRGRSHGGMSPCGLGLVAPLARAIRPLGFQSVSRSNFPTSSSGMRTSSDGNFSKNNFAVSDSPVAIISV